MFSEDSNLAIWFLNTEMKKMNLCKLHHIPVNNMTTLGSHIPVNNMTTLGSHKWVIVRKKYVSAYNTENFRFLRLSIWYEARQAIARRVA